MALRARLKGSRTARLAAVLAVVLLLHAVALQWLSSALEPPSMLKRMAAPMFTRVLQQEAPPPVVAAATPPAAAAPTRPTVRNIPSKAARKPAAAASSPAASKRDEPQVGGAGQEAPAPRPPASALAQAAAEAPPPQPPASAASPADTAASATAASPSPAASTAAAAAAASSASASASSAAAAASSASPAPAALASASAPRQADLDAWPPDTRLNYRLTGWFRGELYGSARVQWQREQANYQTRIEIDVPPFVYMALTSQGRVGGQGLSPNVYEEQRRSGPRGVRLTDDAVVLGDGRRLPRPPAVQDTASQFVELSHRFATGREKMEVGRSVQVWLARPGGVDLWTYDIVEREVLRTPTLGAVEAWRLKPRPIDKPRGNITAEMWFAPSLQYLPVRIKINMGPDVFVDLLVDQIDQR